MLHVPQTLFYGFRSGNPMDVVLGERSLLLLELLKLVAVLVNDTQWTKEQELKQPESYRSIHLLGELLLAILRLTHPRTSPLNAALIELKNKAMEIFMLLPGPLLATFMQRQQPQTQDKDADSLLAPVIDHLHAMLLTVRVEKTRPLSEMLPTLIVCHNLANTKDPRVLVCFKRAILPPAKPTDPGSPTSSDRMKSLHFKHLTFFLTCLDTDVRRYAGEWLFLLCDQNGASFPLLKCLLHCCVASALVSKSQPCCLPQQ
ncbi:hypothetical protein BBJ28_00021846 [Nothophytophthora sp. Chile5]|nr:hypothetical protein BBJ28_00021846 [Nothophytophthora sp. Chile5]